MRRMKNLIKKDDGVTEITGTMLLLGMAVVIFSVVYFSLLSTPTPNVSPAVDTIAGIHELNGNYSIIIEHRGGEPIDVDSHLIVDIAGVRQPVIQLKDFIHHIDDETSWDFGEQIIYPIEENLSGLQVDAGIAEVHSNSLVLLSTLQKGYQISPFGLGGIWHFNENKSTIAHDSSGNLNHGSISLENWTENGKNGSALSFDGLQSVVTVPSKISLDIRKNLTMEAWVKPIDQDEIISHQLLTQKFAYTPDIIHVDGEVYAIVSEKQSKDGVLVTINLSDDGEIEVTDNQWIFGESTASQLLSPHIIHMGEDIFVISYINKTQEKTYVKTVRIYDNATIEPTGYSISFDSNCADSTLTKINQDQFALVYTRDNGGSDNDGVIRIINMSTSGNGELIDTGFLQLFDVDNMTVSPKLYHLFDDLYTVVYSQDKTVYSLFSTLQISSIGVISIFIDSVNINSSGCDDPFLLRFDNNRSMLFYTNSDDDGIVRTLFVDDDGRVSPIFYETNIQSLGFFMSNAIKISETTALIAFSDDAGGNPQGFFQTISLNSTNHSFVSKSAVVFDDRTCLNPEIFQISDVIFGVAYTSSETSSGQHIGSIKTIFVEPEIEDRYLRVLGKRGSYGFNMNATMVFALINENLVTTPVTVSDELGWYHVVITFDQNYLDVYLNSILVNSTLISSEPMMIDKSDSPLLIGNNFYGIIDEVGVYDRVISSDEIAMHYNYPGSLSSST